jgi:predicted nucleic acid-binding protein
MNELMEEDRLRVSTQVLQELFVTLTRKVSQRCSSEEALAVLYTEDLNDGQEILGVRISNPFAA